MPSSSLIETGGNFEKQEVTGDGAAAVAGGVPAAAVALPTGGGEGDAALFTQDHFDWYNHLPEDPTGAGGQLDDFNFMDDWSLTAPLANSLIDEVCIYSQCSRILNYSVFSIIVIDSL